MTDDNDYGEYPWRNEDVLRRLYHEEGMTQAEVAEELGCAESTVNRYVHKYDLDVNDIGSTNEKIRSVDLEELYWGNGMDQSEVADRCECSVATVSKEMSRRRIPVRGRYDKAPILYTRHPDGHEHVTATIDSDSVSFQLHRLVGVAEWGMDAIRGKDVHHENRIPWDNRPENLELMEHGDHTRHHNEDRDYDAVERDERGRLVSFT